jgi:DnaJ-class molecular chaperone
VTLPIAVHEAALGARVDVPTLGESVRLRIPAGTSTGQQFRIAGHGVPAAPGQDASETGDLVVEVQIVLAALRDERSRALMKEFGQLNGGDVRQHLFEGHR